VALPVDLAELVEGASDAAAEVEQHVGVDHGGAQVLVAEELLDGADVLRLALRNRDAS
jgi:hypothetical protein